MRIPGKIRQGLREKLWSLADAFDWTRLEWYEKSAQYEEWSRDLEVGGLLSNYMNQNQVRVYIKDTIMKGYVRSRQASHVIPFVALGLDRNTKAAESQERPHGRRLTDGRVIAWGSAEDWKLVLMAVHERSYGIPGARPYAAVLMGSVGKYSQPQIRAMVQDAANKLCIDELIWLVR